MALTESYWLIQFDKFDQVNATGLLLITFARFGLLYSQPTIQWTTHRYLNKIEMKIRFKYL